MRGGGRIFSPHMKILLRKEVFLLRAKKEEKGRKGRKEFSLNINRKENRASAIHNFAFFCSNIIRVSERVVFMAPLQKHPPRRWWGVLYNCAGVGLPVGFLRDEITPNGGNFARENPTVGAEPSLRDLVDLAREWKLAGRDDTLRARLSIVRDLRNCARHLRFKVTEWKFTREEIQQFSSVFFTSRKDPIYMCSQHGYHAILLLLALCTQRQLRLCHLYHGKYNCDNVKFLYRKET